MYAKNIKLVFYIIIICVFTGCNSQKDVFYFKKAQKSEKSENYVQAILFINEAIKFGENPELLVQIAKKGIYLVDNFIKDSLKSNEKNILKIKYLRLILLHSSKLKERIFGQSGIAEIYFNNIRDYRRAIEELNRLIELKLTKKQMLEARLKIAKSYYYMGKLNQAEIELAKTDQQGRPGFDNLLLKGHILLGKRQLDEAILIYEDLMDRFSKKAIEDQVFLTLSTCYEEKKDFQKSIKLLLRFLNNDKYNLKKDQKKFIAMKIQKLQQAYQMQPGALQPGSGYRR